MTRRKFLGTTLAGGATLIAGGSNMIFAANPPAPAEAGTNSLFRLGGDLSVNRLGFGAMRITGEGIWGWPPDRDNALRVVRRAIDLGVDLIDTADAYGPPLSKGPGDCHQRRANETWAWTMGAERPPGISHPMCGEQFEAAPARANRFVSIASHRSEGADGRVARSTQEDAGGWKDSARRIIRGFGRRNRSGAQNPADCERAEPVQHWQPKWEKTLTYCEKEGLGFMPWSPIGGNRGLKDNALEAAARDYHASVVQLALAWLLHRSPAMLPIPGTSSVAHLDENMAAAKLKLTAEDWKRVDALAS